MVRYSESFRVKVVGFLDKGYTIEQTAELFSVSMKSVWIWKKMKEDGKRLVFEHVPRSPHRINHDELLAYVKEHPDAYLREISAHFSVAISTIWNALKRLGVKYKKKQNLSRVRSEKTGKIFRISKKSR